MLNVIIENFIFYFLIYFSLFVSVFFLLSLFEKRKIKSKIKRFPKVSILIPAHNEEKNIGRTIKSLLNLNYPKNKIEIIVVDDGSTDNTYKIAKKFRKVKVYKKKQGGKASALNFGIKKCKGEFILTLDADCVVERNCLKKMLKYFEEEKIAAVVPSLKVFNKNNLIEKMQQVEYVIGNFVRRVLWFISAMHVAPGAPIYRAKFLKKNRFDEKNLTEDLEMGLRIISKGYEIAHATEAFVYTVVPRTFKGLMRQRIRWIYGTLHNFKKYGFMFGLKYGDLSIFVMPTILLSIAISCFLIIYTIAGSLYNFLKYFYLSSLVGFEVVSPQISTFILMFDVEFYFTLLLLIIGIATYWLSVRVQKEKLKWYYFFYTLIYGWMLAFFSLIAVFYFILKKRPKW